MGLLDRITASSEEAKRNMSAEGVVMYEKIRNLSPKDEKAIMSMIVELNQKINQQYKSATELFQEEMLEPLHNRGQNLLKCGVDEDKFPIDKMCFMEVYETCEILPNVSSSMRASKSAIAQQLCGGWSVSKTSFVPYITLPNGEMVDCILGLKNKTRSGIIEDWGIKATPLKLIRNQIAKNLDYLNVSDTTFVCISYKGRDMVKLVQALSIQQNDLETMLFTTELSNKPVITKMEMANLINHGIRLSKGDTLGNAYQAGHVNFTDRFADMKKSKKVMNK